MSDKEREEMRTKIREVAFELVELIHSAEDTINNKERRASIARSRRTVQDEIFSVLVNIEKGQ